MLRVERLLIVAAPVAAGKSTLLRAIAAGALPDVIKAFGIEDLPQWPAMDWLAARSKDVEVKCLMLHLDFFWGAYALGEAPPAEKAVAAVVEGAREILFLTLWTPAERLERQFLESRLRAAIPPNLGGRARAALFRRLPRAIIRALARLPGLERLDRRVRGTALLRGLLAVRVYCSADKVARLYRSWFRLCDRYSSRTLCHWIVEYDAAAKIYSREEWDKRIEIMNIDEREKFQ